MTKDTATCDAPFLSTLMAEAQAQTCSQCGRRTAVRVGAEGTGNAQHSRDAFGAETTGDVVWLCFECGHEDHRALA